MAEKKYTFEEALDLLRQYPDKPMSRPVMEALMERIASDMQNQYYACLRGQVTNDISDPVDKMWQELADATAICNDSVKRAYKQMRATRA